jgi:chemotaxis family two-component system response regulator Rcp1
MQILLVEDNPAEVRLAVEALAEAGVDNHLNVVSDGIEALEYLRRTGAHEKAKRPDLVLLDLNMPRMDGREVLREMKGDPALRRIPVVVLTTSHAAEDISKAYSLNANCYVAKPVDLDRFVHVIKSIHHFWRKVARLPRE